MSKKNKTLIWIWLIALLVFPFILWGLPADFFDNGEVILCPSRSLFGIECFGCGMTRAIMHIHHFELEDAIYYNTMSVVVYPGLIAVWCMWTYNAAKELNLIDKWKGQHSGV